MKKSIKIIMIFAVTVFALSACIIDLQIRLINETGHGDVLEMKLSAYEDRYGSICNDYSPRYEDWCYDYRG